MYLLPNGTTNTKFVNLMVWASQTTDIGYGISLMGLGILLIIFSVILITTKTYGATMAKSMLAATFLTGLSAGFLALLGIISNGVAVVTLALMLMAYIFSYHYE